jgi:LacI family transcriptional regulator
MRISEDTRQRVMAAARQLDYHPDASARRMVTGRTSTIGFALRQSSDQVFSDQFLPQVLNGLSQAAASQGYHILIEPVPPDTASGSYARLIRERHVDGIVLSGPRFDDQDLLRFHAEGWPVVLMGQLPNTDLPFVDVDNIGGATSATQHLINLGHRRIALITNAGLAYTASADRLAGYRQALESNGLTYDPALVACGDFTPQSGALAAEQILQQRPWPTAMFVASDTVAVGALKTIRQHGLCVPQDIALVGFDDVPVAEFIDPPLTTIRLPAFGLGWGAADLLIRLIQGESVHQPAVMLETELVIRKSCGFERASDQKDDDDGRASNPLLGAIAG